MAARGYERYVGSSVKGDACIDWDDKKARAALLGRIVGDADRLLELSRRTQGLLDEDSTERQRIVEASELLGQLLLQDVERTEEGVCLKEGVSRDRMVSVHDPEMRHGHKSSSKRLDGHKASVAVDTQDGYPDQQNGSHSPTESLLVRRGGLRSVPAKRAVCGIRKGQRSDGETSSAGSDASAGSCVAEERRVCRVSSAAGGGRAQVGASGTAWSEAGAVLRTYQDAVPAVDGGGCSQPGSRPSSTLVRPTTARRWSSLSRCSNT